MENNFTENLWADIQNYDWGAYLSSHVERAKEGHSGWMGCCPFHDDRNPSFSFTSDGRYLCFSCQEQGNIYTFVQKHHGLLEHTEIMEFLAREAGLSIEDYLDPDKSREWQIKKQAEKAKDRCNTYFVRCLNNSHLSATGKSYLLTEKNISDFGIGYCGEESGFFDRALQNLGTEVLVQTGLARTGKGEPFLCLYNHVTFPIRKGEKILGWTARNLSYSKESPTWRGRTKWLHIGFNKSDVALGLNSCTTSKAIVLCEGPWDLLAVRIACPDLASVAILGTSLGNRSISDLKRQGFEDFVICLDSDSAGQGGTKTLIKRLLQARQQYFSWPNTISVAVLPPGKDPGDLGTELPLLESIVRNPLPWQDWWIDTYSDGLEGAELLRKDIGGWRHPPFEATLLVDSARSRRSPLFAQEVELLLSQKTEKKKRERKQADRHPLEPAWVMPFKDCPPFEKDAIRAEIARLLDLSPEQIAAWDALVWDVPRWGNYKTEEEFRTFFATYKRTKI